MRYLDGITDSIDMHLHKLQDSEGQRSLVLQSIGSQRDIHDWATEQEIPFRVASIRLEKAMATHSSILAWKIPWVEEPGRLQSMGLLRVGHDWAISLSLFTFMHWRRKWQPTPVFLPGKSHGWRNLVGYSPWGSKESDVTRYCFYPYIIQATEWLKLLLKVLD